MQMRAFTLIELLIVIGIFSILSVVSFGVSTKLEKRSELERTAREVQSVFNVARDRTLAGENEQGFGVYIDVPNKQFVIFPGLTYVSGNPQNEIHKVSPNIFMYYLEIPWEPGNTVTFDRITGTTEQPGLVNLAKSGDSSRSILLCIFPTGNVEFYWNVLRCRTSDIFTGGGVLGTDLNLVNFPGNSGDPVQSFTASTTNQYLEYVTPILKRTTASPSDIYMEIRSISPVGNVVGRSLTVKGSSLATLYPSPIGARSFIFPMPISLAPSTTYFLRMRSLPHSTVYDPLNPSFSATGTIHWIYRTGAYAGGNAWRYVEDGIAGATGESRVEDLYVNFVHGVPPPPLIDSRHLEFELGDPTNPNQNEWSIRGRTTLTLTFSDPPNPTVVKSIAMAPFFSSGQTVFDWQGDTDVNGDMESLRIHSLYIDQYDTLLSIHRDRSINSKAVSISIDTREIVFYAANGTPTVGTYGGKMIYR